MDSILCELFAIFSFHLHSCFLFVLLILYGLIFCVSWFFFFKVVDACWQTLEKLRDNYGIQIRNISIPYLEIASKAHAITILSEFLTGDWKIVNHEYDNPNYKYTPSSQAVLDFSKQFDNKDFIASQQVRTIMLDYFENVLFRKEKIDIVVTPTVSIVATKYIPDAFETGLFDSVQLSKQMRYMGLGNLIGIPALTMPIGYSSVDGSGKVLSDSKLPIGLQLMANHWNEHVLFRVGNAIESIVQRELPPENNRVSYEL